MTSRTTPFSKWARATICCSQCGCLRTRPDAGNSSKRTHRLPFGGIDAATFGDPLPQHVVGVVGRSQLQSAAMRHGHRRLEQQQALCRLDAIRAATFLAARERELVHRMVVGLQRQLEAALAAGRSMTSARVATLARQRRDGLRAKRNRAPADRSRRRRPAPRLSDRQPAPRVRSCHCLSDERSRPRTRRSPDRPTSIARRE